MVSTILATGASAPDMTIENLLVDMEDKMTEL